jgi:hypothetical protein
MDCPNCAGSGYVEGDDDATIICARRARIGAVFMDEDAGDALSDARD